MADEVNDTLSRAATRGVHTVHCVQAFSALLRGLLHNAPAFQRPRERPALRLDMHFAAADPRRAFHAWREQVHGVFGGLEIQTQRHCEGFSAHLVIDQAPGLRVGDIAAAAQTVQRPDAVAQRGDADDIGLLLQIDGSARVEHGQAHTLLMPGEALLLDNTRPYRLDMPQRFRQAVLLVKREHWSSRLALLDAHVGQPVPALASGRLLLAYARALLDESGRFETPALSRAAWPLMDLVLAAYAHTQAQPAESKSVAALRQRILRDIREQLTDTQLSPSSLAQRQGISVRYLHRLFQRQGQTLMAHVAAQRMLHCQRLLMQPGAAGHRARSSDLALACGYADESTFRRAFKQHFGCAVGDFLASRLLKPGSGSTKAP